ncbi:MAG: alpha/beta fold hydrolase [Acidimicrobiales bacterium]
MAPEVSPEPPLWFQRALAVPYEERDVTVDGADVHYVVWGPLGAPGLLFVHGGAAHSHWWTHVAAQFADRYRVGAIDLTGHGDSDHRERYAIAGWADEVMAVCAGLGCSGTPVIIGHSMGGFVSIVTAALHGDRLAGIIVCDSPVNKPDPEVDAARGGLAFGRPKVYPTLEAGMARFRPVPEQSNYRPYVVENVARHSLKSVPGGFTWKFDRNVFGAVERPRTAARPYLSQVRTRVALLASEHGLVTPDIGRYMYEQMGRVAPVIELPGAGHHAMLDVPQVLLTAVRTLLADWEHSVPFTR